MQAITIHPYDTINSIHAFLPFRGYRHQDCLYGKNEHTVHIIMVQLCIAEVVDLPL